MSENLNLTELKAKLGKFADERNWNQFHSPKNLAMALSVEASELLEIFQWLTPEESEKIRDDEERMADIGDEVADIVAYAVRLCSVLDIDLPTTIEKKMKKNEQKYPVK